MTKETVVGGMVTGNFDAVGSLEDPNSRKRGRCGLEVEFVPR